MDGRGRVFYTSMGHREDVWTNKTFQQIVLGASVGLWVMLTPTSHTELQPGHTGSPYQLESAEGAERGGRVDENGVDLAHP